MSFREKEIYRAGRVVARGDTSGAAKAVSSRFMETNVSNSEVIAQGSRLSASDVCVCVCVCVCECE
jgi:hypothetical protein